MSELLPATPEQEALAERLPEPPRGRRLESRAEIEEWARERYETLSALWAEEQQQRQLTLEDRAA